MCAFLKKIIPLVLAALLLCGCGGGEPEETVATEPVVITLPPPPTEEETVPQTDPREEVEYLTVEMQAGEIYTLEYYPNLKAVDFSTSTCYDTILNYMQKHPEVEVTYNVSFGGTASIGCRESSATLARGSFAAEQLLENLQYLPKLTSLSLTDVDLTVSRWPSCGSGIRSWNCTTRWSCWEIPMMWLPRSWI